MIIHPRPWENETVDTNKIVQYAAEECKRQRSGELSVWWFYTAWEYAFRYRNKPIDKRRIVELGKLVEPSVNREGMRNMDVRVGDDKKVHWKSIHNELDTLLEELPSIDPAKFYRRYEDIHPFADGNGRTGTLLYNWMLKSLGTPIHPPDWDDPVGYWSRSPEGIPYNLIADLKDHF